MGVDLRAVRRTMRTYRGTGLVPQAWVLARFVVAPLGTLEAEFRGLQGRVLSLGPGLCILERYLLESNPDIEIHGLDLDPARVAVIEGTRARSPRLTVELADATKLDGRGPYDAVLVCDAFHHFLSPTHEPLARAIAAALRPGGVVIVKDLDVEPRWKHEWNRWHDRLVAGPEPIHCRAPAELAGFFRDAGLVIERVERTEHRLTPYAHYLIRARKPLVER